MTLLLAGFLYLSGESRGIVNQPLGLEVESMASIESEPRTLSFDQLQYAREAALYVLSTRTLEEAISIFTEGLQPVLSVKGMMDSNSSDDAEELDQLAMENLSLTSMRDRVSAPF